MEYITLIRNFEGIHHGINIFPIRCSLEMKSLLDDLVKSMDDLVNYNKIKQKIIGNYND